MRVREVLRVRVSEVVRVESEVSEVVRVESEVSGGGEGGE